MCKIHEKIDWKCKDCRNQYRKGWNRRNPEKRKEANNKFARKYALTHKQERKEYSKEWYLRNKQKRSKYYEEWYANNGRNRSDEYQEIILLWKQNNPEKIIAHKIVRQALVSGKIIRPKLCHDCRREKRLSGHHEDYSKPLVIIWVCASCHKIRHSLLTSTILVG